MNDSRTAGATTGTSAAHHYTMTVRWSRGDAAFTDRRYSRAHTWSFDGGIDVPASASPLVVPPPFSDTAAVDPEEAFVASIASCHMLFFLDYAAQAGYVVDAYTDAAVATMGTNAHGNDFVARVVLAPQVTFAGERIPDAAAIAGLHDRAHHVCFIANSVLTEIVVQPAATA
jgi:organic hydroperoxide reductase OsmC/OhrA